MGSSVQVPCKLRVGKSPSLPATLKCGHRKIFRTHGSMPYPRVIHACGNLECCRIARDCMDHPLTVGPRTHGFCLTSVQVPCRFHATFNSSQPSASRHHGGLVAIGERSISQVAETPLRQLWVLPRHFHGRGFRPPFSSLRTKTAPGGYQNQTHLRVQGIPLVRARADRAGGAA